MEGVFTAKFGWRRQVWYAGRAELVLLTDGIAWNLTGAHKNRPCLGKFRTPAIVRRTRFQGHRSALGKLDQTPGHGVTGLAQQIADTEVIVSGHLLVTAGNPQTCPGCRQ